MYETTDTLKQMAAESRIDPKTLTKFNGDSRQYSTFFKEGQQRSEMKPTNQNNRLSSNGSKSMVMMNNQF